MSVLTAYGEKLVCQAITQYLTGQNINLVARLTAGTTADPSLGAPTKQNAGTPATMAPKAVVFTISATDPDTLVNAEINFGDSTVDEIYNGIEIWDGTDTSTANRIMFGTLATPSSVVTGQSVKILAGSLTFSPDANN